MREQVHDLVKLKDRTDKAGQEGRRGRGCGTEGREDCKREQKKQDIEGREGGSAKALCVN